MNKKALFSIPNLMSCFRILLIPFIVWRFFIANTTADYEIVAFLVFLSGLTDLLDGKIARKFNMVTELGKALDPIADKLTLGALILCFSTRNSLFFITFFLFLIKEGFMGIMSLLLLKRNGKKLDGAKWFGKVCTASLYLVIFLFLFFPNMPYILEIILVTFCTIIMLYTLFSYIPIFHSMWNMDSDSY